MDDLGYFHLDRIGIDGSSAMLCVDYSQQDQGGTRLLLQFRVPRRAGSAPGQLPILQEGYAHDAKLRERPLLWQDLPDRVRSEATAWLTQQRHIAETSNRDALVRVLADFEHVLGTTTV